MSFSDYTARLIGVALTIAHNLLHWSTLILLPMILEWFYGKFGVLIPKYEVGFARWALVFQMF